MRTAYHSPYDLDRYPLVATATRFVVGAVVIGSFVAAGATAGPGNGYVPPEQWAMVHRTDVARVALPRVVVTAQREEGGQKMASVSCPKGA